MCNERAGWFSTGFSLVSTRFGQILAAVAENFASQRCSTFIDTFAMESAILRTRMTAQYQLDITQVFCCDAMQRIEATVKTTLSAMPGRSEIVARLAEQPQPPYRATVAARQRIAKALVEAGTWIS